MITAAPVEKPKGALWIAGGDLIELAALQDKTEGRRYAGMMSEALRLLRRSGRLVITAVDGAAIGGGAELALAGDIRLATERSYFEFKQLRAGLATGYGSARRLVDLIGLARSERLLYFCEKISAAEAAQLGLVHRLADSSAGVSLSSLRRSAARSSASSPRPRQRASGNGGLARQVRIRWMDDGSASISAVMNSCTAPTETAS